MEHERNGIPVLTTNLESLPEPTARERMHIVMGRGITLLDRFHFTEWSDYGPDDYTMLAEVQNHLYAPVILDNTGCELVDDTVRISMFREALGTDTNEEAVTKAARAARMIGSVTKEGIDRVPSWQVAYFYEAQDVVKSLWRTTMPLEFQI